MQVAAAEEVIMVAVLHKLLAVVAVAMAVVVVVVNQKAMLGSMVAAEVLEALRVARQTMVEMDIKE
jgi:hypothetical protein